LRAAADQALAVFLSGLVRVLNWSLLPVNHFYGTLAGLFLCVFGKNVKRITRTNLAIAFPDLNQEERAKLARKSVLELGKTMSELGPAWCGSKRRLLNIVTEVHGEDIVQQAMQDGRGVLILGPHFGAWEIAGMYLSIQYDILGLYRRPRLAALEALTRRARTFRSDNGARRYVGRPSHLQGVATKEGRRHSARSGPRRFRQC
jgi:KDO2-lipid IV(A) lauroyltransferase